MGPHECLERTGADGQVLRTVIKVKRVGMACAQAPAHAMRLFQHSHLGLEPLRQCQAGHAGTDYGNFH